MKITAQALRDRAAFGNRVARFKKLFGSEVDVTEAICVQHAHEFDWDWAAQNMLSAPAWAEYERVEAAAWAEYERVRARAFGRLAAGASQ